MSLSLNKKRKSAGKPRKPQEAQKARGMPGSLPGSLGSRGSREVGGAPVTTSLGTLPEAFQKVLGP